MRKDIIIKRIHKGVCAAHNDLMDGLLIILQVFPDSIVSEAPFWIGVCAGC